MTKSTGSFPLLFSSFFVFLGGNSVMRATTPAVAPLPIEDVLVMKSPGPSRQFSPDGKWLAYTIRTRQALKPSGGSENYLETGVPWDGAGADVVITDIQHQKTYGVTQAGDNWLPSWSPDSRYLAFLSDGDGSGQAKLWVWSEDDHRCRKVADLAIRASQITWTPDSQKVLVTAVPEDLSPSDYARRVRFGESLATFVQTGLSNATIMGYESPASLDPWNLNYNLRDLALLDIASGRTEVLTHHRRISSFDIFPDGSRAAFSTALRFEQRGSQQAIYDLVIMTFSTKAQRTIATALRLDMAGRFSISPT